MSRTYWSLQTLGSKKSILSTCLHNLSDLCTFKGLKALYARHTDFQSVVEALDTVLKFDSCDRGAEAWVTLIGGQSLSRFLLVH